MDKNLNIINPEDKDYYDGKLYMVGLYPGAGAELKTFYVYARYEEEALELVIAHLDISSDIEGLLMDSQTVEDIVYDDYEEEYNNWLIDHPELDWFEFAHEYLGYVYVDATMKGASQPYFVEGNYLRIEEVNEDKEVKTEDVKEYLRQRYKTPTTNYIAKCTLTDGDKKFKNEYLLLDTKDSNGMSGVDIILENNKFNSLWYNCDYGVEDLEIVAEVKTLDELIDFMKSVGVDLSGMIKDGEIEVGMSDRINQNLYRYVVDDEESDPKFFGESKEVKTEANQYQELRDKHQKEFDEFPIGFAFSDKQFKEQMEKLGLTVDDEDKVVGIGAGGFIRKDDVEKFKEMNTRHRAEEEEAIKNDTTGEGYIKDMFDYELANHEYGYTYDLTDTLDSLGLSMEDIQKDEKLKNGLRLALKRYDESKELKTEAYSKDELKELLNSGEILKVGQTNFKFENGQVWFYDPSITFGWENDHPRLKTVDDLVNHLDKLQSNKYKINVVPKDVEEKSDEEMYDLLKSTNVKNWYKDTFPQDELADEINDNITFYDVFNALDNHKDIYNLLGVDDSVVRERVCYKLDDILDEPEGYSYEQWTLTEGKEVKTESVEPEENKKLDLKDRVKYAYENCNYSKRKDMPTVSDIMDYLGLDTYNNKLYNQISDILYELGYDWQLESKQIKSNKEIKTENFKAAEVEENPEIKDPHFWWEDKDTFVMEFEGGVDNEGDKYWYLVEYWADEDTYHFFKQYDYDTLVLKLPEDKKEQIINMMKAKMN